LRTTGRVRDLALFNCAIDAKLRGCDLVKLRICDVAPGGSSRARATVIQQKTGQPVPFEITSQPEIPWRSGCNNAVAELTTGSSQAGLGLASTSRPGNMLGL